MVAKVTGLIGVLVLFYSLLIGDIVGLLFALFAILCGYAWSLVGELWKKVENLESEIHRQSAQNISAR